MISISIGTSRIFILSQRPDELLFDCSLFRVYTSVPLDCFIKNVTNSHNRVDNEYQSTLDNSPRDRIRNYNYWCPILLRFRSTHYINHQKGMQKFKALN